MKWTRKLEPKPKPQPTISPEALAFYMPGAAKLAAEIILARRAAAAKARAEQDKDK